MERRVDSSPTVESMSALDFEPADLIREVSSAAIDFYVRGLNTIELPDDFMQQHRKVLGVEGWSNKGRLEGKFGRYIVHSEDAGIRSKNDVIVMGTTLGVGGLDRDYGLRSLRHYELQDALYGVLIGRGVADAEALEVRAVDYGSTVINLTNGGDVESVTVRGRSIDYGRGNAVVREKTCELFVRLLDGGIKVINADPDPKIHEYVMKELGE